MLLALTNAELPECFKQDGTLIGYFSARECCLEKGYHYMYEGDNYTCIGGLQEM